MEINGAKVVDATKKVVIKITNQDCKKGNTKDPGACAAALACLRELPNCTEARVHLGRTYVKQGRSWVRYHTPQALRSEIVAFDRGGKFAPGEYTLTPMQPAKRTGKQQGTNTRLSTPKKFQKPRAKYHVISGVRQHGANK